ncbi:unnamed protein product [Leuciscus chuanchicus]
MLPAFILIRRNVVKQKMRSAFGLLTRPQEKRPELRCMKPDSPPCSPSFFALLSCTSARLASSGSTDTGMSGGIERMRERENAEAKFAYHIRREVGDGVLEQMSICIFNSGLAERGLGDVIWTLPCCVANLSKCVVSLCAREGAQKGEQLQQMEGARGGWRKSVREHESKKQSVELHAQ